MATTYTLELHDWSKHNIVVTDNAGNPVCTGDTRMCNPRVTFQDPKSEEVMATATFPMFASNVQLTMRNTVLSMSKQGMFSRSYSFTTSTGESMTWHTDSSNVTCVDSKGQTVAQITRHGWTGRTRTIELAPGIEEEVLLAGVVMVVVQRKRHSRRHERLGTQDNEAARVNHHLQYDSSFI
ncbi:hypothetical protein ANO11243_094600 [Dothideomycetidae sp. 11243]|nr:hypothetical protein ANO11243_094600 [fungal sp. No.11243]